MSKLLSIALPVAASIFAPGLGTALGSSLLGAGAAGASTLGNALVGAGLGAASGGGLKGALLGGVTSGIGANLGSLGSGVQGPGTAATGGAPIGGGSGILGSIGDYAGLTGGDIPSISGLIGSPSSSPLSQGVQGPSSPGSGILGSLGGAGRAIGTVGNSIGGLSGTGGGSTFGGLTSALGGLQENMALNEAEDDLIAANQQQLANLESFDPSGLGQDPGYQFRKQEGETALNRSLGARGNLFSGRAIKAGIEQGQNLADEEFDDYYDRWLKRTQGQNQLYGSSGDVRAAGTIGRSNSLARALAGL